MSDIISIGRKAGRLKTKYGDTDPFALARDLHILIMHASMGTDPDGCKGFFIVNKRIPVITVNCDLPEPVQRMIAAHEIGHYVLHHERLSSVMRFTENALLDNTSRTEYEANIFAAELLLDDEEVKDRLTDRHSFPDAAKMLRVDPGLLCFKMLIMKKKGVLDFSTPFTANSRFMKGLPTIDTKL